MDTLVAQGTEMETSHTRSTSNFLITLHVPLHTFNLVRNEFNLVNRTGLSEKNFPDYVPWKEENRTLYLHVQLVVVRTPRESKIARQYIDRNILTFPRISILDPVSE